MLAALAVLAGSFMPVAAQGDKKDAPTLDVKAFKAFDPGAPVFYQIQKTDTTQTMTVMNQEVTQKQSQTFYISWTSKSEKDKDFVVVQKIIGVKLNIDIGGNKINYDSTSEDQAKQNNPMTDFFNALKTLELTFTIDPKTLAIKKVEGGEKLIEKLSESTPPMKALLKNILSDEAIKQMAQPTWGAIPTSPKKVGETWNSEDIKLNLGAIGSYDTKFTYKLEAPDAKKSGFDKITVTPKLTYKAPTDKSGAQLPFEILSNSTLTSVEDGSKGEVFFNREKGRIDSSNITMKLEGNLVIKVGTVETTVKMKQDQVSTATFSEANPLAPAKK